MKGQEDTAGALSFEEKHNCLQHYIMLCLHPIDFIHISFQAAQAPRTTLDATSILE